MGEVQYIWADPSSPQQQVALSSIVQAMYEKGSVAIARWVSKDSVDVKMGVLFPEVFEKVECFLWTQVLLSHDSGSKNWLSHSRCLSQMMSVDTPSPRLINSFLNLGR